MAVSRARTTKGHGWLGSGSSIAASQWVSAFSQRLRELGRIEGNTVAIEYRWAEGREIDLPRSCPNLSAGRSMSC